MDTLSFSDYRANDALGLAALVRHREVSPAELLACAIKRYEEVNPHLNAVVMLHETLARDTAARKDLAGPFAGVPFLLKDLFVDLEGTVSSDGCYALRDRVATSSSTITQRYVDAGLVIFGKTHSPEFGLSPSADSKLWGSARNPWSLQRTPGGSSGGSAAAVASGIVPAANASDAGGSIRTPAAACGLFGMKPTRGHIPLGPSRYEGGAGMATLHAVTRSVRDSAALLDATAGPDLAALYASPSRSRPFLEQRGQDPGRIRIGVLKGGMHGISPEQACTDAVMEAANFCMDLGHHVEEIGSTIDFELYKRVRTTLRCAGVSSRITALERHLKRSIREEDVERATWQIHLLGQRITGAEVLGAREGMFQLHRQYGELMKGFDVLLCPTTERLAPFVGECGRRRKSEPLYRPNIEPGVEADVEMVGCG